jgi:hypothetical protein
MYSKAGYSIQSIAIESMAHAIAQGANPLSLAPVGETIARLVKDGGYIMRAHTHEEFGLMKKSWMLERTAPTVTGLVGVVPDQHRTGMEIVDKVQWKVDQGFLGFLMDLVPLWGKGTYPNPIKTGPKTVTGWRFVHEYIQPWELEALVASKENCEFSFIHGTDSRGGRFYAFPFGVESRDGGVLSSFPTTDSGDISSVFVRATPVKVSKNWIEKVWLPHLCQKWSVDNAEIHRIGSNKFAAIAAVLVPTGNRRSLGQPKRNSLEFVQDCRKVVQAHKNGETDWYLRKDSHADGIVRVGLAIGSEAPILVKDGKKVYDVVLGMMKPLSLPSEIESFVYSKTWAKMVALAGNYTAKYHHGALLYGIGHTVPIVDQHGQGLAPAKFSRSVLNHEKFVGSFKGTKLDDGTIHAIAEEVSAMSAKAFRDFDPRLSDFIDKALKTSKAVLAGNGIIRFPYRGFQAQSFKVRQALEWFPADKQGVRELPTGSITIPKSDQDLFRSLGYPTRFQPHIAPFVKGESTNEGQAELPWKSSGVVCRDDTANCVLATPVSLCDSSSLAKTMADLEAIEPGCVTASRHDCLFVTPGKGFDAMAEVYVGNMYDESVIHLNKALATIIGMPIQPTSLTKAEVVAASGHFFR